MARDYGIAFYAAPTSVGEDPADDDVKLLAEWFVEQVQTIPPGTTTLVLDNARAHNCPKMSKGQDTGMS